jgi:hypothetical protein
MPQRIFVSFRPRNREAAALELRFLRDWRVQIRKPLMSKLTKLVYLRVVVDQYADSEELRGLKIPPNVRKLEIETFVWKESSI